MTDPRPRELHLDSPPGTVARLVTPAVREDAGAVVMTGSLVTTSSPVCVLFAPGRWQNGLVWQHDDPRRDFRFALAAAGVASVTVRYRTTALQAPEHHEALAACGTDDLVADITRAARLIATRFSPRAVVVAGYSLGAMLMCLALPVVREILPVAGVVLLDGGFGAPGPGVDQRVLLPNPAREPRLVSRVRPLLDRGGPIPVALRFSSAISSVDELRFLLCADRWWPGRQIAEMRTIVATGSHRGRPLDAWLAGPALPALAFATTHGTARHGHRAALTAELIAGNRARTVWLDGWSHAHVLAHPQAPRTVQPRLLTWVSHVAHHARPGRPRR